MKHPDESLHREIKEITHAIRGASFKADVPMLRSMIRTLNYLEDKEILVEDAKQK